MYDFKKKNRVTYSATTVWTSLLQFNRLIVVRSASKAREQKKNGEENSTTKILTRKEIVIAK